MSHPPQNQTRRTRPGRLRPVPNLPDYPDHLGQPVHWKPWQHAPQVSCIPAAPCTECASTARPYYTHGLIEPRPGQTVQTEQTRHSARHPGRSWRRTTQVPAWSTIRLCAFACADCGALRLYDQGEDGTDFLPLQAHQPPLF